MPVEEIKHTPLIFLSNVMQAPDWIREAKIPLEFVSFAYTEGRMYTHYQRVDTFICKEHTTRRHGNSIVYGGLYLLKDFDFYIRLLDAYQVCSLSTLFKNHDNDLHFRKVVSVTPIHFTSQEQFERLLYKEEESVPAYAYFGNPTHPKIKQRIVTTNFHSYRISDGVDKTNFLKLLREEIT